MIQSLEYSVEAGGYEINSAEIRVKGNGPAIRSPVF